jgi:hypothetical protein
VSTPFESLVVDALDRIERKVDSHSVGLAEHAETDRRQFDRLDATVDTLLIDHTARKTAAEEAGRAAAGQTGRFWAAVGAILSALIAGAAQAWR